ncbi:phosphatase PAP2 family protein [Luteimonas sp. S4-F44]|uniref:phosphatase PAP2 family protein n=1 Tax=Luteimonas sp. S4-F44 TaxID=2925842 RepID=UPI001F536D16|nr:phosphatase PAP2 family protein [Luteimonas sp. S4-F44]UNK42225.1 phosphatase PAP2 family protein [Luteimonas sp. S4-F44]
MAWNALTPLGDAVLVVPLLVAVALWLRLRPGAARLSTGGLLHWAALVAGSLALVAASKVAFYGWGTGIRYWDLTCFSGHAALAWLAWPALFALLVPPRHRALRAVTTLAGAGLAALVAWSRVPTGAHPPSEVIAGVALGLAACLGTLRLLRSLSLDVRGIMLAAGLAGLVALGAARDITRPDTERWFAKAGVAMSGAEKPQSRWRWWD